MYKKLDKSTEEFKMFGDYWKMVQDFYVPEDADEYWEALVQAMADFTAKHNGDFARELAITFGEEQERKWRAARERQGN